MRLTLDEQRGVAAAASVELPRGTRVLLFGSRVDDARRGGDVDLLVETPPLASADLAVQLRNRFTARLYRNLGERRVDVLMAVRDRVDDRAVVAAARRDDIELART